MRSIAGLLLLAAGPALAAPPAATDPWARVPKLTTSCYSGSDPFTQAVDQAYDSLQEENYRQQAINSAIDEQLTRLDPMEKQNRMQAFLMKSPQDAMKYMQTIQSVGIAFSEETTRDNEAQQQLDAELEGILAKNKTALDQATGPLFAKLRALPDGEASTAASNAEATRLAAQVTAEYERRCPGSWGAAGTVNAWFAKYKTHLQQDHISSLLKLDDQKTAQYRIFGIPSESYRSTIPNETVLSYLDRMRKVFGQRWDKPYLPN
ncbi:MAG TPA: hypothetical protein VFE84_07560 [Patescibacteria group bacterium]|nr:hypothetical protein [Patescibacteria group bacterium]